MPTATHPNIWSPTKLEEQNWPYDEVIRLVEDIVKDLDERCKEHFKLLDNSKCLAQGRCFQKEIMRGA